MKFTTWCVGWLVIIAWADSRALNHAPASWPVILGAVTWLLLGAGMGLITLIRLTLGKVGAGGLPLVRKHTPTPPAPTVKGE